MFFIFGEKFVVFLSFAIMLLILLPWVVLSVLSATKNILSKYAIRRWMRSICYNL